MKEAEVKKPTAPEPKPESPASIGDPVLPKEQPVKPQEQPVTPKEQPVVQLVKPLTAPLPRVPVGASHEFESGYMTGYERGIAAERELLMKEFEHKH